PERRSSRGITSDSRSDRQATQLQGPTSAAAPLRVRALESKEPPSAAAPFSARARSNWRRKTRVDALRRLLPAFCGLARVFVGTTPPRRRTARSDSQPERSHRSLGF